MRGRVNRDESNVPIVVYYRECIEDSEAVIPVSCRLMPGFETLFKVGDSIEFELIEFAQEDGSFSSYARPYLTINPHITKVIDTNEDGEADMGDKMVALLGTLKSKIYWSITNDGSTKGCGLAMKNAENIENLFDEYAVGFADWLEKSGYLMCLIRGSKPTNKLLEIFKKEKGL